MFPDPLDVDMSSLPPSPAPGSPVLTRSRPSTPRLNPIIPTGIGAVHRRARLPKRNRDADTPSASACIDIDAVPDSELLARPVIKRKRIAIEQISTVDIPSNPLTPVSPIHEITPAVNLTSNAVGRPRSSSTSSIVGLVIEAEPPSCPSSPSKSTGQQMSGSSSGSTPPPSICGGSRLVHVSSPLASAPIVMPDKIAKESSYHGRCPDQPQSYNQTRASSAPAPPTGEALNPPIAPPHPSLTSHIPLVPGVVDGDLVTQVAKAKNKLLATEVEHLGVELNKVFALGYGRGMARGIGGSRRPSRLRDGVREMKRSASDGNAGAMDLDE